MKLTKILSRKFSKIRNPKTLEPEGLTDSAPLPPSPEPSPTPNPDFAKIQALGVRLIAASKEKGEDVNEVFDDMVTSYEDGTQSEAVAPEVAASPTQTVNALDGMGQTFSALADTFKAMDDLKSSLAESLLPAEEAAEPSLLDDLGSLGVGPEHIKLLLSKMSQPKRPADAAISDPVLRNYNPQSGGGKNG